MPRTTASAPEDLTLKINKALILSFPFPMRRIAFFVSFVFLFLFCFVLFFVFSIADLHFMLLINVMQCWPGAHN